MTWAEKVEYIFNRRKPQKLEQMSEMVNDSMEFVGADDEKMEYTVEIKIIYIIQNFFNLCFASETSLLFLWSTGDRYIISTQHII
mgnify:CR=1 FL=1